MGKSKQEQWSRVERAYVASKEEVVYVTSGKKKSQSSTGDQCSFQHESDDRAPKPTSKAAPPSEPSMTRSRSASRKRSVRGRRKSWCHSSTILVENSQCSESLEICPLELHRLPVDSIQIFEIACLQILFNLVLSRLRLVGHSCFPDRAPSQQRRRFGISQYGQLYHTIEMILST